MSKTCDYYTNYAGKEYCILKKAEISWQQYADFCKYDDMKECPIYQFYKENR